MHPHVCHEYSCIKRCPHLSPPQQLWVYKAWLSFLSATKSTSKKLSYAMQNQLDIVGCSLKIIQVIFLSKTFVQISFPIAEDPSSPFEALIQCLFGPSFPGTLLWFACNPAAVTDVLCWHCGAFGFEAIDRNGKLNVQTTRVACVCAPWRQLRSKRRRTTKEMKSESTRTQTKKDKPRSPYVTQIIASVHWQRKGIVPLAVSDAVFTKR